MKYNAGRFISYFKSLRCSMGTRNGAEIELRCCVTCIETKPVHQDFPTFSSCATHSADVCLSCIYRQTVSRIESHLQQGWAACTCPECDELIPKKELHRVLPRQQVKELKALVKRAQLPSEENWRNCLAEGCNNGALYPGKSAKIQCRECAAKACFKCQVLWHEGQTCEEYERSRLRAKTSESDEVAVKKITKECPKCRVRVMKNGGCDVISCKCQDPYCQILAVDPLRCCVSRG